MPSRRRLPGRHRRSAAPASRYLAANVFFEGTNRTIFPPYKIKRADGAKIAFIGMTFEATPTVVTPSGVAGLEFRDEVETANALVRKLRRERGVEAFVVLLHQGGTQRPPAPPAPTGTPTGQEYTDVNKCVNFNGAGDRRTSPPGSTSASA